MSSRIVDGRFNDLRRFAWRPFGGGEPAAAIEDEASLTPEPSNARRAEDERLRQLLADAEQQSARLSLEAYHRGRQEGAQEGERRAQESLRPVLARLAQAIEETHHAGRRLRREAEQDVVKLALLIARRVIHRELSMDPAALVGMVRAAFTRVDQVETTRVRVHPDDAALLAAQVRDLSPTQPPELIPDGSLERGSIVIETQRGSIDASVSTQLEEIERGLTDQLRRMR